MFFTAIMFIGCNVLNVNPLKCVLMNNQECKIISKMINTNRNEPSFYPYSIEVCKRSGSCNNINDPYAKLCAPDVVKNKNFKVFYLMSSPNEIRHIKWYEACKCECRLDTSVCNNKQRWNNGKCRYECKELMEKGRCDKGFIWNPSNCECECDKSCDIGQYLDYKNCKCRKEPISKLVEESSENIDGNEMIYNETLNYHKQVCNSCTIYIALLFIFAIKSISISSAFIYFH